MSAPGAKPRRGSVQHNSLASQQMHAEEQQAAREQERRSREREKMQRDEAKKSDYLEKQKLLNQLEGPLVSLLERLGVREELSLALAQQKVYSLSSLRGCDHELLARTLLKDNPNVMRERPPEWMEETLAKAVDMARRDLAIAAIERLMLPDDYIYQQQAREQIAAQEKANRTGGEDMNIRSSYSAQKNAVREEDIASLRNKDGVLRKALLAVTERWQDFMASQPAFAARLSEADTGPSWKDTVSWSLWMLTRPLADAEKNRSQPVFMTKAAIEQCLKYAKDYVYFALYPQMKKKGPGEWRLYWVRVFTNFAAFYSEKGRQRWMDVAACAARATALRQNKSVDEQTAAEVQAVRNVCAMLRSHHARRTPREPSLPVALRATPRTGTVRDGLPRGRDGGTGHLITHVKSSARKGDLDKSGESSRRERATSAPPERHILRAQSTPALHGRTRYGATPGRGGAFAASPGSTAAATPPSHRRGGADRPSSGGFPAASAPSTAPPNSQRGGGGSSRRSKASPAQARADRAAAGTPSPRTRGTSPPPVLTA